MLCIGMWISLTTAKTRVEACLCPTTWLVHIVDIRHYYSASRQMINQQTSSCNTAKIPGAICQSISPIHPRPEYQIRYLYHTVLYWLLVVPHSGGVWLVQYI